MRSVIESPTMNQTAVKICFSALGTLVVCGVLMAATRPQTSDEAAKPSATRAGAHPLQPFNSLIGSWRGVGQLKRGSQKGSWIETVTCEWSFKNKQSTIVLKSEDGKQFQNLAMQWDEDRKELLLRQTDGDQVYEYRGKMPEKWPDRVQLVSSADAKGVSRRCTIQQLSDIRSTLLFEVQTSPTGSFRRVAGIGYTRSGEKLAVAGGNQRKCIVTGGLGTIPVTYKGETFYVCCQGCVQAFNDAPEEIIADYRESLKAIKK